LGDHGLQIRTAPGTQSTNRDEISLPDTPPTRIPRAALWLGLTGTIPFFAGNVAIIVPTLWPDLTAVADQAVKTYGAVILSFLGGIRWGLGMSKDREERSRILAMSVVPALFGWFALFLPDASAVLVLAGGVACQGFWDIKTATADGAPQWYPRLRISLTILVCLLLTVFWIYSS